MTINVERLRAELEYVTAHSEEWDQSYWAKRTPDCGTTYCLAGWTVVHEGIEIHFYRTEEAGCSTASLTRDGRWILDVARGILGIDANQADYLFFGGNSLHDLWRKASDLTDGAIQIPDSVSRVLWA